METFNVFLTHAPCHLEASYSFYDTARTTTDDGSKIGIPTKNVEFLPAAHTSVPSYFQNPPALMCKNTDPILMMVHIYFAYLRQIRMLLFPSLSCIFDKSYIALLPDNQTTLLGYCNLQLI